MNDLDLCKNGHYRFECECEYWDSEKKEYREKKN